MNLFSRKSEAPAAPAKQRTQKGVTVGELAGAIKAVSAAVMVTWATRKTIEGLDALLYGAEEQDIVNPDGPSPVSLRKFDEALADLDDYDLPADTLSTLKRLRVLLAKAAGAPVTRAEFDALVEAVSIVVLNIDAAQDRKGYPDGRLSTRLETVIAASGELNVSSAVASMLQTITGQISIASKNVDARDRKRAGSKLNIVPGGGGRGNY